MMSLHCSLRLMTTMYAEKAEGVREFKVMNNEQPIKLIKT